MNFAQLSCSIFPFPPPLSPKKHKWHNTLPPQNDHLPPNSHFFCPHGGRCGEVELHACLLGITVCFCIEALSHIKCYLSGYIKEEPICNETYQLNLLIGQTSNISKSVVHALTPYFLYIFLGLQAHT